MNEPTKIFPTADAKEKANETRDGFDNFLSRLGLNNDNTLSAGQYEFNLMTRNRVQLEAAYRGSWVVGQIIDAYAEDMTKAGIDIQTATEDENISKIQTQISRKQIWPAFCSLIKWGRLYGGAIGVLQIKGQKLDTPLDVATVGKGQFIGLSVYDRWQLQPDLFRVIQEGPEIGLPMFYDIITTSASGSPASSSMAPEIEGQEKMTGLVRVHHSRVIRNIGIQLPFFQAITEQLWGESVLERLWDRLISFDSATMSSANLIERANNRIVRVDKLREIIAAGGKAQQGLESMFEMMRVMQTNEGLTLLDKEDEFESVQYTFSGLDALLLQFGQQLAGASGIPLVRLFGQSPAGLSATGESDLRTYYDNINSQQESRLRSAWDLLLKVLWQSTFGKPAPDDIEFDFVALWQMSALDKATIAKSNTETIVGAVEGLGIKRSTGMKELRDASGDNGLFSNISDDEIAEAEEEDENPPLPVGNIPGENESGGLPIPSGKDPAEVVKNLDSKWAKAVDTIRRWVAR